MSTTTANVSSSRNHHDRWTQHRDAQQTQPLYEASPDPTISLQMSSDDNRIPSSVFRDLTVITPHVVQQRLGQATAGAVRKSLSNIASDIHTVCSERQGLAPVIVKAAHANEGRLSARNVMEPSTNDARRPESKTPRRLLCSK